MKMIENKKEYVTVNNILIERLIVKDICPLYITNKHEYFYSLKDIKELLKN